MSYPPPVRWTILTLLALTRAAQADTTAKVDVDGDGKIDTVTVDAMGVTVKIGKKEHAQHFAATGTFTSATVTSGGKGAQPYLAIDARFDDGGRVVGEGLVLQWQKGKLVEVWRGEVGPIGRDGDYEVVVAATPTGLTRTQRRGGIERCDGAPSELFKEAWDGKSAKFRPVRGDVSIAAGAKTLTATHTAPNTDAGEPTLSSTYRATVTSSEAGASDASQLGAPHQLDDGDPSTVWKEDRGGDGRGEWFTFRARTKGAKLSALRILAGDARGAKEMAASNRVAKLALVTADHAYWIELADDTKPDAWWVTLPAPIATDCVTVLLGGFHSGKGMDAGKGTSAISELVLLGEDDLAPGGAAAKLVADVIAGGLSGDSAAKLLARRGAAAARAIETALAGDVPGDAKQRLLRVLAAIGDPGSAATLGAGLRAPGVADDAAFELAQALGALGDDGQAQLAKVLADAGLGDGARLAAAAAIDPAHADAMIAALGVGSRTVRKALAMRLASLGVPALIAATTDAATNAPESEADLWRAMGLAAMRADDGERQIALVALAARGREATTYELRYRITAALAPFPEAEAAAAIRAILEGQTGDEGAALRQVAAAGLVGSPSADAEALLAELATDGNPGVRIAALAALADRGAGASSDAVMIDALAGDLWPEVRHTAAAALARACPRPAPTEALEHAAETDTDVSVRVDALGALVACDAPGIADRLIAVARDGKAALSLRERAVDLLGVLGDPATASTMVDLLGRWRSAAFSDEAGLVLAQRAAIVVGQLGAIVADPKVLEQILDALYAAADDGAFPELQAAGAAGLGALGPRCDKESKALLVDLKRSDQAAVKLAAEHALATCGQETK